MDRIKKEDINAKEKNLTNAILKFKQALDAFKLETKNSKYYEMARDSLIQRFEFSIELLRKYLIYRAEEASATILKTPRELIRECIEIKLITKEESIHLSIMIDDRNKTSHAYDENLAEELAARIPEHYKNIKMLFDKLTNQKGF